MVVARTTRLGAAQTAQVHHHLSMLDPRAQRIHDGHAIDLGHAIARKQYVQWCLARNNHIRTLCNQFACCRLELFN